ncbi:hypothetical protein BDD12DRAFT_562450 [Trichophaea hybrida]|nr:hypothetical protein BDD12DRAFT_562450 [Trichophaea hybrida]
MDGFPCIASHRSSSSSSSSRFQPPSQPPHPSPPLPSTSPQPAVTDVLILCIHTCRRPQSAGIYTREALSHGTVRPMHIRAMRMYRHIICTYMGLRERARADDEWWGWGGEARRGEARQGKAKARKAYTLVWHICTAAASASKQHMLCTITIVLDAYRLNGWLGNPYANVLHALPQSSSSPPFHGHPSIHPSRAPGEPPFV